MKSMPDGYGLSSLMSPVSLVFILILLPFVEIDYLVSSKTSLSLNYYFYILILPLDLDIILPISEEESSKFRYGW